MKTKKPKKRQSTTIVDQLKQAIRQEIREKGLTNYRISKDAGIAPDQLSRFMAGERDLLLETAAKIAGVLGLELQNISQPKGKA